MPRPISQKRLQAETIYLGVDPGKGGGLAILYSFNPTAIRVIPMPPTELEIWAVFYGIQGLGISVKAMIERVHSMPQQGVASMFSFGQSYGSLRMALTAIGASWEDVPPQTWMKALNIPSGSKDQASQKEKLRKVTQQLYPKLEIWSQPKSLGRQRAICDALLIAHYCKLRNEGTV